MIKIQVRSVSKANDGFIRLMFVARLLKIIVYTVISLSAYCTE